MLKIDTGLTNKKSFVKNGYLYKSYNTINLLDVDWRNRVSIINQIGSRVTVIPSTEITVDDISGVLIYRQLFIAKQKIDIQSCKKPLLEFADGLDSLTALGFIHGDINRKNIIFSGKDFFLIDLEPSLKQLINYRETLLWTPPYISKRDFLSSQLSIETDKIGFFYFCLRLLISNYKLNPREKIEQLISGNSSMNDSTCINEESLIQFSFNEIALHCLEIMNQEATHKF